MSSKKLSEGKAILNNVKISALILLLAVVSIASIGGMSILGIKNMNSLDKEVNKLMEDYEKTNLSDEEKAGLEEFKKSYQDYLSHWYSIKDSVASGAMISNEDKDIFVKYSEDAQSHVESLVEYNLSSAEEMASSSQKVASTAQTLNGMAAKLMEIVELFKI